MLLFTNKQVDSWFDERQKSKYGFCFLFINLPEEIVQNNTHETYVNDCKSCNRRALDAHMVNGEASIHLKCFHDGHERQYALK